MTNGSTTTPRAAAPQLPRFVKRLGVVGLLAVALLFVHPSQMPGAPAGATELAREGAARAGHPTFTVATLVAREPLAGPPLAARAHLNRPGVASGAPQRPL
jgi:hypothetical protein